MDIRNAEATSQLLVSVNAALDARLTDLLSGCTPVEAQVQRRLFGAAMASLLDIANALYQEHPSLKPVQMGGSYNVNSGVIEAGIKLARQSA